MQRLPEEAPITNDRQAVLDVLAGLIAAWARHDADYYGALFTSDASYTTFVGTVYRGRTAIIESHRALFGAFLKNTTLADKLIDVRFYGPDTAVVTTRGDTVKGSKRKTLRKAQTYTVVREADGQWRIAAFHNTKHKPLLEAISAKLLPATAPS